ncbi:MAG: hypothetical protein GYA45_07040 [Pelolinea sp.]|nr:hypothetical protein [Pelolinea sp.]
MEKTAKKRIVDVLILLLILLLSVGAASLVLYATRWGPWAFSDSAAYLSCARNYSAGLGLSMTRADGIITPLTLFPPGYAFLLSRVSVWVGSDLLAARVIDALCFGLVVFIVAAGLLVLTQDRLLAVASAALVVASPVMLENFTGLMSEPLFLFLFCGSFFSTLIAIQKQKDSYFIPAVFLTALAGLVRYVGVILCAFYPLLILLFSQTPWKERRRKALLFAVLALLPALVWLILSSGGSRGFGGRSIRLPAGAGGKLLAFLGETSRILQGWIPYAGYRLSWVPQGIKVAIILYGLILVLFALDYLWKKRKTGKPPILLQLIFSAQIYCVLYCVAMGFSDVFASVPPVLNTRLYSPLWVPFVLLALCGMAYLLQSMPLRWKKVAALLMAGVTILFIRYYALRGWSNAQELRENGYGYTSRIIQSSTFLQRVEQIPVDVPLISNDPGLVLFYTNRMPYELKLLPNDRLGEGSGDLDAVFVERKAALIVEYASIRNTYADWQVRLGVLTAGLNVDYQDEVGGIYYFPH